MGRHPRGVRRHRDKKRQQLFIIRYNMGFIKIHESLAGKVFVGERAVGGIYVGDERVYPSITGRHRCRRRPVELHRPHTHKNATPMGQDLYADGSRGEKRYTGTSTETQTAAVATGWTAPHTGTAPAAQLQLCRLQKRCAQSMRTKTLPDTATGVTATRALVA